MRWADLEPEPAILKALTHAGERPEQKGQNEKRRWSERFAHACAVGIADELRQLRLAGKRIAPVSLQEGTEPLTPLGAGQSKRIDVTVADSILGLEIGLSLKGLNFKDPSSGNFDKNLTGRLYELADEMRVVHEHLPHAFMAAIIFLPLAAVSDKSDRAKSSFAHAVLKTRDRTGRLDVALAGQASRSDASFIALYSPEGETKGIKKGVVRLFDVATPPPMRGRPQVANTVSLKEAIREVVARARYEGKVDWGPAEEDD